MASKCHNQNKAGRCIDGVSDPLWCSTCTTIEAERERIAAAAIAKRAEKDLPAPTSVKTMPIDALLAEERAPVATSTIAIGKSMQYRLGTWQGWTLHADHLSFATAAKYDGLCKCCGSKLVQFQTPIAAIPRGLSPWKNVGTDVSFMSCKPVMNANEHTWVCAQCAIDFTVATELATISVEWSTTSSVVVSLGVGKARVVIERLGNSHIRPAIIDKQAPWFGMRLNRS